jgi:hypothetical protein
MKNWKGIIVSCLILFFAFLNFSCSEVQPQLKTVKLLGGEEVPDIRGDWKVDYEYYGRYQALSGYCNMVKILQDENRIMALVKTQDQFFSIGSQIMRGDLSMNGFKTVQIWTKDRGWLDCEGIITDNGNKIVLIEPTQKRTLTRKR